MSIDRADEYSEYAYLWVFESIISGTSTQFLSPGHVSMAQGGDARQSLANRPRVGALRALAPAWHGDFGCHMNPNEQLFSQLCFRPTGGVDCVIFNFPAT